MEHYVVIDEFGIPYLYTDLDKLEADIIAEQRRYDDNPTEIVELEKRDLENSSMGRKQFYYQVFTRQTEDSEREFWTSYHVECVSLNDGIVARQ